MSWKIFDTGRRRAEENMALDAALLEDLEEERQPILHLYDWEGPSATYGHFLDPYSLLDRDAVEKKGVHLAKRPTGGGIVFHLTDFAFSILVPSSHPAYSVNTLENYAFVNRMVARSLQKVLGLEKEPDLLASEPEPDLPDAKHFCMAKPTLNDVMLEGKKIGGGAQRRTKYGFLHQGTLSLAMPDKSFFDDVLKDPLLYPVFLDHTSVKLSGMPKDALSKALIDACNEQSGALE